MQNERGGKESFECERQLRSSSALSFTMGHHQLMYRLSAWRIIPPKARCKKGILRI